MRDAANHVYKFGTFSLGARQERGAAHRQGHQHGHHPLLGPGYHVWNNTGDKAYLRNAAGTAMDYCAWTSK